MKLPLYKTYLLIVNNTFVYVDMWDARKCVYLSTHVLSICDGSKYHIHIRAWNPLYLDWCTGISRYIGSIPNCTII